MLKRLNTFQKIIIMLAILLIPVIVIYTYSNRVNTKFIQQELIQLTLNQQHFLVEQLDMISEQLGRSAYMTLADPNALMLQSQSITAPRFENFKIIEALEHHLRLQSTSFYWQYELALFSPMTNAVIATNTNRKYDLAYFQSHFYTDWSYQKLDAPEGGKAYYFIRHMTKPFTLDQRPEELGLILEIAIPASNIAGLMEQFSLGRTAEPLFYHPDYGVIASSKTEPASAELYKEVLRAAKLESSGHDITKVDGHRYLLNYTESNWHGWYLVDFVPLKTVVAPLNHSLRWFYFIMALLMLIGFAFAVVIYRSVQIPIVELIKGVRRLKQGNYSFRIAIKGESEFHYLFSEFNRMSEETQQLIEKVYVSKLRVRDATLKQLQSQINPHFLYNNFAFIQSMTQMGNKQAVIAFTQHLSQYYRYTTRTESSMTAMAEELHLVQNYLEIHKMQIIRLTYELTVPKDLLNQTIPKLIIQPVVENAIVHGIETMLKDGFIRISGRQSDGYMIVTVEDNGTGLAEDELEKLQRKMTVPIEDENGFGLWNIHQRLMLYNGDATGLKFRASPLGGLLVEMRFRIGYEEVDTRMDTFIKEGL
ncbi:sensor histidine kinase [Paenibacillus sp. 2TAB23]|uniref:sensor histidine kinase n=1 Tax=Paenibacillus sp. 2TAB23 TaxID=3233004 RepID=UPI003F9D1FAA